jgi:hypothetical protein
MRLRHVLALAVAGAVLPAVAAAEPPTTPPAPACATPGAVECPVYERYENHKYGFSVDLPTFFVKKAGDADGRGQPFEYGSRARVRAWAMFDNPPMTVRQLYADWTRRDNITFKTLAENTWVVRGRDGGRLYYSRSILADGIISTLEISYDRDLADLFEPILARAGASLMVVPNEGIRGKTH